MSNTIVKLVYKRDFFDIEQMRPGAKHVTTITDDGQMVEKAFAPGSRKAHSVKKAECSSQAYVALCEQILSCIEEADRLDFYVDDASEELTIYHRFGRTQKMDRGLGNEHIHIGVVMRRFLAGHFPE